MKAAVLAAIEDWVAPGKRHVQTGPDPAEVRAQAIREAWAFLRQVVRAQDGANSTDRFMAYLHEAEDAAGSPRTPKDDLFPEPTT